MREHDALDLTFPEFDVDVLRVDLAHDAAHQFVLFIGKFAESVVALDFVQLLQNNLLCRLRGDAAEILRHELLVDQIARLIALFQQLRFRKRNFFLLVRNLFDRGAHRIIFDAVLFGIDADIHVSRAAVVLFFVGGDERVAQRIDKNFAANPLFRFQIGQSLEEFLANHCLLLVFDVSDYLMGSPRFNRNRLPATFLRFA